ncbi:MAG: PqqD family protein [Alphaproteobacteria bacterium]
MSRHGRYRRSPGINETPVEDELFLIADDSGDIYHLDQPAMSIWRALEQSNTEAELVDLFSQAFPETTALTLQQDLCAALLKLQAGGLIELFD